MNVRLMALAWVVTLTDGSYQRNLVPGRRAKASSGYLKFHWRGAGVWEFISSFLYGVKPLDPMYLSQYRLC